MMKSLTENLISSRWKKCATVDFFIILMVYLETDEEIVDRKLDN